MPLDLYMTAGTYFIEDDGIRGNNISLIRNAGGTFVMPFVHPADSLGFYALEPGVNFVFNFSDFLSTAVVTVGNPNDSGPTPDSIVVRSMRGNGFITLASNGAITEGGSDTAADIVANAIVFSAASGVGTSSNALETETSFIEAETGTGGINISNYGPLQIGGISSSVDGLDVFNSGDLTVRTTGFFLFNDTTGPEVVHGGSLSGNVTLSAIGADADMFATVDAPVVSAEGGGVTLNAGRDLYLGTAAANFNNDVLATRGININAGRDFVLDGTADIQTSAFGGIIGGDIDIRAGRNIALANSSGGLQTIEANIGDLTLTTGPGGSYIQDAGFPTALQSTQDIIVNADAVQINSGGINTTGMGSITIRPVTSGRAIDIGSTLTPAAALALSEAELDRLYTLFVNIGDANTGPVEFTAPISPTTFPIDLAVRSATDILVRSSISLDGSLTLHAGDDLVFTPAGSFTTTRGGFNGFVDDAQEDDDLGGFGALAGPLAVITTIQLTGNLDADTLRGSIGNDILDGRGGADMMIGGAGNDTYHVDAAGDAIQETAGGGTDVVYAGVTYTLTAGAEVETLSTNALGATTAINLIGNELDQVIYGNAGVNSLNGGGENDTLIGLDGNDVLNGGTSNDTMHGGTGNDTYHVDAAGDAVYEAAAGGSDVVYASVSYTLTAGAEVETLSTNALGATTAINLNGNAFGQVLYGNAGVNSLNGGGGNDNLIGLGGNDVLNGSAGNDTMNGGIGNDTYHVDAAGDVVQEAAAGGSDLVYASVSYTLTASAEVETLSTNALGATTAINLTGNALGQVIYGNAGANVLNGLGGNDTLIGLGGMDTFAFTTALGAGNVDTISGFSVADDTIQLENAVFTGLAAGALAAGAFNTGAAASQADDRIVYNSATGALLFDADGTGASAAVQFASLSTGLALTASDFLVV